VSFAVRFLIIGLTQRQYSKNPFSAKKEPQIYTDKLSVCICGLIFKTLIIARYLLGFLAFVGKREKGKGERGKG
jgi:hypothetical protein